MSHGAGKQLHNATRICAHLMDGHSYARASEIGVLEMSGTHGLFKDAAFGPCSASVAAGDTALMQAVPFSTARHELLATVHRHADLPLPVQEAFHRGPWQACRSSQAQTRTKAMLLGPRAALRHSKGVGVQASSLRCLFDRATHGHASAVGLSRVRPQHRSDACSQQTLHALLVHSRNVVKRGILFGRNIAGTYVILNARGQAFSAHMRRTVCLVPRQLSRESSRVPRILMLQGAHFRLALTHSQCVVGSR